MMTSVNLNQQVDQVTGQARPAEPARSSEPTRPAASPARSQLRQLEASMMPAQALRRTGQRPYAFNGLTLATICGVTPVLPFWYELNLFRTVIGSYVCNVRLFNKGEDADVFRASEHEDLEAACAYFEDYDPTGDLAASPDELSLDAPGVKLSLQAARLQLRINRITEHYRATAGELLYALDKLEE